MKKFLCIILVCLLIIATALSAASCSDSASESYVDPAPAATIASWQKTYTAGDFGIRNKKDPFVEFTLNTGETIRVELYPTVAPISVDNFITYVKEGFYTGVAFHRIIEGRMIQCGGFEIKDNKYVQKTATHDAIKGEFLANGVMNTLSHTRGVISMARTSAYDSATSQFFICSAVVTGWNGLYAAFGRVIDMESMAVVSRLEKVETAKEKLYGANESLDREVTEYEKSSDVPVTRVTVKKAVLVWDNNN